MTVVIQVPKDANIEDFTHTVQSTLQAKYGAPVNVRINRSTGK